MVSEGKKIIQNGREMTISTQAYSTFEEFWAFHHANNEDAAFKEFSRKEWEKDEKAWDALSDLSDLPPTQKYKPVTEAEKAAMRKKVELDYIAKMMDKDAKQLETRFLEDGRLTRKIQRDREYSRRYRLENNP